MFPSFCLPFVVSSRGLRLKKTDGSIHYICIYARSEVRACFAYSPPKIDENPVGSVKSTWLPSERSMHSIWYRSAFTMPSSSVA